MLTEFWEFKLFGWLVLALVAVIAALVGVAWWQDRRKWRSIQPYYGKPYDASNEKYRANVRLVRP